MKRSGRAMPATAMMRSRLSGDSDASPLGASAPEGQCSSGWGCMHEANKGRSESSAMPWADAASSKEAEGSRRVITSASAWCIRSGKSRQASCGQHGVSGDGLARIQQQQRDRGLQSAVLKSVIAYDPFQFGMVGFHPSKAFQSVFANGHRNVR